MSEHRHLRAVGPAGDIPDGELTVRVEPTPQERLALARELEARGFGPPRSVPPDWRGPGPTAERNGRRLWALAAYEQLPEWRR